MARRREIIYELYQEIRKGDEKYMQSTECFRGGRDSSHTQLPLQKTPCLRDKLKIYKNEYCLYACNFLVGPWKIFASASVKQVRSSSYKLCKGLSALWMYFPFPRTKSCVTEDLFRLFYINQPYLIFTCLFPNAEC